MQTRQIAGSDSPSCAVLVVSCHRYRDLWTPFFTLFKRYWPDCNMPVFLGTDSGCADLDWVSTLNAPHSSWSNRLRCLLESFPADYVLLLLEDFFFDRQVSTSDVTAQFKLLQSLDGVAMRLFPNPPADYCRDRVGVIHRNAAYRVSLQASIWHRRRLLELLVDGESPWDFEWNGSRRSQDIPGGFYCVRHPVIHYRHVIERGVWFRGAAQFYRKQNIGCNFDQRPTMGLLKATKKNLSNRIRKLMTKVHSHWLCVTQPEKTHEAG